MKHAFFLVPSSSSVGLTTISLGVVRALERRGAGVGFMKPIAQPRPEDTGPERSTAYAQHILQRTPATPIPLGEASRLFHEGKVHDLMEEVVNRYERSTTDCDVVIVEGLVSTEEDRISTQLNQEIARTLGAEVILVDVLRDGNLLTLDQRLRTAGSMFGGIQSRHVVGCILNRIESPEGVDPEHFLQNIQTQLPCLQLTSFTLLGSIPASPNLLQPRMRDIVDHLKAEVIERGEMDQRRVSSHHLLARTVPNLIHVFSAGSLILTPADREDILMAAALASIRGQMLAGVILTGGKEIGPNRNVLQLCRPAFEAGLPLALATGSSIRVVNRLATLNTEIPIDDTERLDSTLDFIARRIDVQWILEDSAIEIERRLSPPAFRFQLAERARQANKRILLPEGDEPRTLRAAVSCHERRIARCVLLGSPETIQQAAAAQGINLPDGLEILDPGEHRDRYIAPLVEARKHKNLTEAMAAEALEDNVFLATVMLLENDADGLVSGAVHSTANTIRPALQLIKTKEGAHVVSSVFFMCLPDQVLVYGDCAVNTNPDAETLADIALRSAESAEAFGIPPRVALISYSTGASGAGEDVDKVRRATELAQKMRPDLPIDGPLQYDAAAIPEIGASKAPGSPVAGQATVFIFPDLNTGNTTYKAVQRSAKVVSIGPMLQGLRKPVNDLSRGALVDDIIYTIALTAIQADQE
ncbi:MAG: phosphate acetyltransferase [Verrucomicrobiota bacterium]